MEDSKQLFTVWAPESLSKKDVVQHSYHLTLPEAYERAVALWRSIRALHESGKDLDLLRSPKPELMLTNSVFCAASPDPHAVEPRIVVLKLSFGDVALPRSTTVRVVAMSNKEHGKVFVDGKTFGEHVGIVISVPDVSVP